MTTISSRSVNPEVEVPRFLTQRGFPNGLPLHGWYEYDGRSFAATLGVVQHFPDPVGGWELALGQIAVDPDPFLYQLGNLGAVTADMRTALGSDASDPDVAPSNEALSLLTATIDENIEHCFAQIDPTLLPIGEAAVATLLSIFELEKPIYELQCRLENQADWLPIPAAGIARLLDTE